MSCGCTPPVQTSLWTPIGGVRDVELQPGENIDCYVRRADDSGLKDDAREAVPSTIANTSITADGQMKVKEQFRMNPGRVATNWTVTPAIPNLTMYSDGRYEGTIADSEDGKTFKVKVEAHDSAGLIDSREYTLAPAKAASDTSITMCHPYVASSGSGKITSGFGPRMHPIQKVQKLHKGQDWVAAQPSAKGKGTIVAVADGEVVAVKNDGNSGYGINIQINHRAANGSLLCMTLYGHLSQALVTVGQQVTKGQTIGKEGSTGGSTGPHLHFEVRLGGTTPVDPSPYFSGQVIETPPPVGSIQPPDVARTNTAPALTQTEVIARTTNDCPPLAAPSATTGVQDNGQVSPSQAPCFPDPKLTPAQAKVKIQEALNSWTGPALDEEDKNLIMFIARIESGFDPYAKNPTSSATGLYQMLDKTAATYYAKIGVEFNCLNRVDPVHATHAMCRFYVDELRKYYQDYQDSSGNRMANKTIKTTAFSQTYPTLTKAQFIYGLIHHDGVGNAINGNDLGGVAYFKRRAAELGYA